MDRVHCHGGEGFDVSTVDDSVKLAVRFHNTFGVGDCSHVIGDRRVRYLSAVRLVGLSLLFNTCFDNGLPEVADGNRVSGTHGFFGDATGFALRVVLHETIQIQADAHAQLVLRSCIKLPARFFSNV